MLNQDIVLIKHQFAELFSYDLNVITIGNDSVSIQLAQCWFSGLAISNAKIKMYFSKQNISLRKQFLPRDATHPRY